jgi:hypothetical protein
MMITQNELHWRPIPEQEEKRKMAGIVQSIMKPILSIIICVLLLYSTSTAGTLNQPGTGLSGVKMDKDFRITLQARQRIIQTLAQQRRVAKFRGQGAEPKASEELRSLILSNPDRRAIERLPMFIDSAGRMRISVSVASDSTNVTADLEALGFDITLNRKDLGSVVVAVDIDRLPEVIDKLETLPSVKRIRPVFSGKLRSGLVNSEGDEAVGALSAREKYGLDGSGARVCVISDGVMGAAAAADGELPLDDENRPAIEICPLNENSGSEGTAMLEIVHDLAPGAELGFCPAFGNDEAGFVAAIEWLTHEAFDGAGCDVIIDDAALLTEPYFQDGPIAQAVNKAALAGVSYFVSAGNDAANHYEGAYIDADPSGPMNSHDFGLAAGGPSSIAWVGVVAPGTFMAAFAQWSEAFGTAASDYNLLLFDENGVPAGSPDSIFPSGNALQGNALQDGDDDPLEVAMVFNPSDEPQYFLLVVDRIHGEDHTLEINFNGANYAVDSQFNVTEGSVWGHAAARQGICVAATGAVSNVDDTPNPNLDIIEPFSSQGPARIYFSPRGRRRYRERNKPDITAPDGVSVSGAGGFPTTFYGTSASAPHAGAVAALLIDAVDRDLPPWVIRFMLKYTAEERGKVGTDNVWGRGFIDAFETMGLAVFLKR